MKIVQFLTKHWQLLGISFVLGALWVFLLVVSKTASGWLLGATVLFYMGVLGFINWLAAIELPLPLFCFWLFSQVMGFLEAFGLYLLILEIPGMVTILGIYLCAFGYAFWVIRLMRQKLQGQLY